jgi:hypothetical protein
MGELRLGVSADERSMSNLTLPSRRYRAFRLASLLWPVCAVSAAGFLAHQLSFPHTG